MPDWGKETPLEHSISTTSASAKLLFIIVFNMKLGASPTVLIPRPQAYHVQLKN
jgi:hypothetical protein